MYICMYIYIYIYIYQLLTINLCLTKTPYRTTFLDLPQKVFKKPKNVSKTTFYNFDFVLRNIQDFCILEYFLKIHSF